MDVKVLRGPPVPKRTIWELVLSDQDLSKKWLSLVEFTDNELDQQWWSAEHQSCQDRHVRTYVLPSSVFLPTQTSRSKIPRMVKVQLVRPELYNPKNNKQSICPDEWNPSPIAQQKNIFKIPNVMYEYKILRHVPWVTCKLALLL